MMGAAKVDLDRSDERVIFDALVKAQAFIAAHCDETDEQQQAFWQVTGAVNLQKSKLCQKPANQT